MRYALLILLNVPIVLLALLNIITQFKMKRATKQRFRRQIILWIFVLVLLVCSFPFYNYVTGKPLLSSADLSVFDIVEVTAIIILFYMVNKLRQRIDFTETYMRDLQQELSIRLSDSNRD